MEKAMKSKKGAKVLKLMKCKSCGRTWLYGGKETHASCPKCKTKNEVKMGKLGIKMREK